MKEPSLKILEQMATDVNKQALALIDYAQLILRSGMDLTDAEVNMLATILNCKKDLINNM